MGQTNNQKSNFHFLILDCKSFAVYYSLKSGTHRHHQMLGFIPGDALPGLYCNRLQFLLVLGAFSFSFVFRKWNACSIGFRSGDWLGHCITFHFFALKNSSVAFTVCFGSLSICTVKRVWQTLIWSSCFWGSPMVYILWWTLCIHSGEVFCWLLTLTHIHLPPGECSWSGQLLWRGFSSPGK